MRRRILCVVVVALGLLATTVSPASAGHDWSRNEYPQTGSCALIIVIGNSHYGGGQNMAYGQTIEWSGCSSSVSVGASIVGELFGNPYNSGWVWHANWVQADYFGNIISTAHKYSSYQVCMDPWTSGYYACS